MRLGIDFGTTRTVVASAEQGSFPVCTFCCHGELREYVPSVVAAKNGTLHFGWEALRLRDDPSAYFLRSIKRLSAMASPDDLVELEPGLALSVQELITRYLAALRTMILKQSNLDLQSETDDPLEVVVGVPANACSNQRYITMEAFRRAGFKVLAMLNEPSAAAVEFVHRYLRRVGPRSPKRYVVVYDLGGGTFDTAVVGLAGHQFEVLAHAGIARLGGDDFDEVILERVLARAGRRREDLDRFDLQRLQEECRERKEGLRPNTRKLAVDLGLLGGEDTTVIVPTDEIYARCDPLIQPTLQTVRSVIRALQEAGIDPEDSRTMAAIYLVGGSVVFPPVARALREAYDRKLKVSPYPHAAAAIGMAIAADPGAGLRLTEAISRNFGVWREHQGGREKVFDPIFHKDNMLHKESGELVVTRRYRPAHNVGRLRYLECSILGDRGEPQGDITVSQEICFPYDPALRDREDLWQLPVQARPDLLGQEVVETYTYDAQGIIRVKLQNLHARYSRSFTLGLAAR